MVAKILYFANNNITPYIENFLTDNRDGWELLLKMYKDHHPSIPMYGRCEERV